VRIRALGVATLARFLNETPTVSRTEASTLASLSLLKLAPSLDLEESGWAAIFARGIRVELARILGPSSFIRKDAWNKLPLLSIEPPPYFAFSFSHIDEIEGLNVEKRRTHERGNSSSSLNLREIDFHLAIAHSLSLSFVFLSNLLLASRDFTFLWGETCSLRDAAGGILRRTEGEKVENSRREARRRRRRKRGKAERRELSRRALYDNQKENSLLKKMKTS
jgi:hypothetical protein